MLYHRLTTVDNPFDPFDEFDQWLAFDSSCGYKTSQKLAKAVQTSEELPESFQNSDIEKVIDEIVANDPLMLYRKVSKKL